MKQRDYTILHEYGPLRVDLTPLDLYVAGYFIRAHIEPGKWCWWRKNPYDPKGVGEIYGAAVDTIEDAVKDARRLIAARAKRDGARQLALQLEAA